MKPFYAIILVIMFSCSTIEKPISKENSIEVVFETSHFDDKYDILKTTKNVYIKNLLVKQIQTVDTIPVLEKKMVKDESRPGDQIVQIPGEYEIYVTIK
jgi:hypothetical protein